MAGFSSEPPPVFVHPSSLDLQCVALTAAQGTIAPILSPKAPDIHPVLSDPASTDSYQPAQL